ncbi:MAG: lipopolysaccharide heptosyltransferase II [Thermodesulfobacteriota bacterium]
MRFLSREVDKEKVRKILVRGTNWVGDAVMTIPAIAALREVFPKAEVSLLIKPVVKAVFENSPDIDRVIIYDKLRNHKGLSGKQQLIRTLKEESFDMAVLFQNAFEAAFLSFLAGIPIRVGYATDGRSILLTDPLRQTNEEKKGHQVYSYLKLIEYMGYTHDKGVRPRLFLSDEERKNVSEFLKRHNISSKALLVGISPAAQYGPAKMWLPERFAEVADRLIQRYKAEVMIFGTSDDLDLCREVSEGMRYPSHNMAGMTGLREFMALVDHCSLFLTNDSGPMHIAGALDTPLIAIFGSTDSIATGPMGERSIVIKKDVDCSPCFKRDCPTDFRCMELIAPDEVFDASTLLLEKTH